MRLTSHRALTSSMAMALSASVVLFFSLVVVRHARGQAGCPNWPITFVNKSFLCAVGANPCPVCPGPGNGCTSAIPVGWGAGTCNIRLGFNCTCSTFSCGPQIVCATGNPNGFNCASPTICK